VLSLEIIVLITEYQHKKYTGILDELETNWEHLSSNIFEYNDTLPTYMRSVISAAIKNRYLDSQAVSQKTYPQLVQVSCPPYILSLFKFLVVIDDRLALWSE
jgi:hypothetical protein